MTTLWHMNTILWVVSSHPCLFTLNIYHPGWCVHTVFYHRLHDSPVSEFFHRQHDSPVSSCYLLRYYHNLTLVDKDNYTDFPPNFHQHSTKIKNRKEKTLKVAPSVYVIEVLMKWCTSTPTTDVTWDLELVQQHTNSPCVMTTRVAEIWPMTHSPNHKWQRHRLPFQIEYLERI